GLLACDQACRDKIAENARLTRIAAEKERREKEEAERQRRIEAQKAEAEALAAQAAAAEHAGDAVQAELLIEEAQRVEQAPVGVVVLPPEPVYKSAGSTSFVKKKIDMDRLDLNAKVKILAQ